MTVLLNSNLKDLFIAMLMIAVEMNAAFIVDLNRLSSLSDIKRDDIGVLYGSGVVAKSVGYQLTKKALYHFFRRKSQGKIAGNSNIH